MQRRDALRAMVASLAGAIALPFVARKPMPFRDTVGTWKRAEFDRIMRENSEAAQELLQAMNRGSVFAHSHMEDI